MIYWDDMNPTEGKCAVKATLTIEVEYEPDKTDAESVASALDTLLETAMSTPGILDDYGNIEVGPFYVKEAE